MDIPPFDPKIIEEGTALFTTHTIAPDDVEGWVQRVATESGQPVDWYCQSTGLRNYAVVKALGDLDAVEATIERLLPEHDRLYREAMERLNPGVMWDDPHHDFVRRRPKTESP